MKIRNILNIKLLSLLSLAFIVFACDNKDDYPALTLGNSSAPTVSVTHISDSLTETYTYIILSSNMAGDIYYVALPKGDDVPSAVDIIASNTSVAAKYVAVVANTKDTVKLKGLASGGTYELYAVATNGDEGKFGDVSTPITINCPDYTAPTIASMTPSSGSTKVSKSLAEIVLTFTEPVELADASKISVVDASDESDLGLVGDITVSGTEVTISLTGEFDYLTDVAVLLEAGAVKDMAGNLSPEYYQNDAGDAFSLFFTIEDMLDMSLFQGAYHCVANEIGFGDGIKEYDVIMKGGKDASGYFIEIQNINNWTASYVYLTVDPTVDTCYFEDQATGRVYSGTGEDIMLRSFDEYDIASGDFKPGNFKRDGSEVKVFGQIYISLGSFGFYEFTFTKMKESEARINTTITPITEQDLKFNK